MHFLCLYIPVWRLLSLVVCYLYCLNPPGRYNPLFCVCLHVCLSVWACITSVCARVCVCSHKLASVCWCMVPRWLFPPLYRRLFWRQHCLHVQRPAGCPISPRLYHANTEKEGTREEGEAKRETGEGTIAQQTERRGNLSPPLSILVSPFSPPPPFSLSVFTSLSSHPRTLFICRFLIFPLTSLIIPPNIVFIITHNNDSHPCKRNVRCAWRIFHR